MQWKIQDLTSAKHVWEKIREQYAKTSLSNKLFWKEKIFRFKSDQSKSMEYNLDQFKMITTQLANIDKQVNLEDQAITLLNSLPESYSELKIAIKYGRENLLLGFVVNSLRFYELEQKQWSKMRQVNACIPEEGLIRNMQTPRLDPSQDPNQKIRRRIIHYHCHKEGHVWREWPLRNNRRN